MMTDNINKLATFLTTIGNNEHYRINIQDPLVHELIISPPPYSLLTFLPISAFDNDAVIVMLDNLGLDDCLSIIMSLPTARKKDLIISRPCVLFPSFQKDPELSKDKDCIDAFLSQVKSIEDFKALSLHQLKSYSTTIGDVFFRLLLEQALSIEPAILESVLNKHRIPNYLWNSAPKNIFDTVIMLLFQEKPSHWDTKITTLLKNVPPVFLPPETKTLKEWMNGTLVALGNQHVLLELLIDTSDIKAWDAYDVSIQQEILELFLSPFNSNGFVPEEVEIFI